MSGPRFNYVPCNLFIREGQPWRCSLPIWHHGSCLSENSYVGEGGSPDSPNTNKPYTGPTNQENITFKSGAASSKIPRFDLIPRQPLVELADRCALGLERHKEKSWNAASKNQNVLLDDEFIIARATHAIDHATKFIEKLRGQRPDDGDNDASAIMWAGMCLSQAMHMRKSFPGKKEGGYAQEIP